MAGEYQLGLEWGRRAVRHSPEVSGHWRALALSAAMLNLAEEARAAVAMARKFQPDYSVAWVERASPLVNAHDRERYAISFAPSDCRSPSYRSNRSKIDLVRKSAFAVAIGGKADIAFRL